MSDSIFDIHDLYGQEQAPAGVRNKSGSEINCKIHKRTDSLWRTSRGPLLRITKLLTRFCLGLSHFNKLSLKVSFND